MQHPAAANNMNNERQQIEAIDAVDAIIKEEQPRDFSEMEKSMDNPLQDLQIPPFDDDQNQVHDGIDPLVGQSHFNAIPVTEMGLNTANNGTGTNPSSKTKMNLDASTLTKKKSIEGGGQQPAINRPVTDIDSEQERTALQKGSDLRMNTVMDTEQQKSRIRHTDENFDDSRVKDDKGSFKYHRAATLHLNDTFTSPKTPQNQQVMLQNQFQNTALTPTEEDIQHVVESYRESTVRQVPLSGSGKVDGSNRYRQVNIKTGKNNFQMPIQVRSTKLLTGDKSSHKSSQWQINQMSNPNANKPISGRSRDSKRAGAFYGQQPLPVSVQGLLPKQTLQSSKQKLVREAATTNHNLNETGSPKLVINMKSIDNDRDSLQWITHERDDGQNTITHGRMPESQQENSIHNTITAQNAAVILSHNSLTKVKQSRQTSSLSTAGLFTNRHFDRNQAAGGAAPVSSTSARNMTVQSKMNIKGQKISRLQHENLYMDWQCFDYKLMERSMGEYQEKLEELSSSSQLQVILVKLWDLGKYIRQQNKLINELTVQARRNEEKVTQHKVDFLINKVKNAENIPLRVLTESECHNLLGKIAICLYIVYERALCIIHKLFNMEKLSQITQDKDEVEFKYFKIMVIALFGNNMFHLSLMDIDSILRNVHKELLISTLDEQAEADQAEQKMGLDKPKTVTDEDLANLSQRPIASLRSIEKRSELQRDLLSKLRLISFEDLLEHVGRIKFGQFVHQKEEAIQQLKSIVEGIFHKANFKNDGPSLIADDEHKNISKVREFIREFWKRNKEAKTQDEHFQSTRNINDSPDDRTKKKNVMKDSVDVWQDLFNQKKHLYKSQNYKTGSKTDITGSIRFTNAPAIVKDTDKVIQPKLKSVIQNFNLNINKFDPKEMLIKVASNDKIANTEYNATLRNQFSPQMNTMYQTTAFSNTDQYKSGELRIKSAYTGSKEATNMHYSNQLLHEAINTVSSKDRGTRGLFSAGEPKRMKVQYRGTTQTIPSAQPGDDNMSKNNNQMSRSTLHGKSKSQIDGKYNKNNKDADAKSVQQKGGLSSKVKTERMETVATQLKQANGSSKNILSEFPNAQNPMVTSQRGIRIRSRLDTSLSHSKRFNNIVGRNSNMKSILKSNKKNQDNRKQKSELRNIDPDNLSLEKTLNSTIQPVQKFLQKKRNLIGRLAKKTNENLLNRALEDLKKDMLTENLVSLLKNSQYDDSLENMIRLSQEHSLGHILMGSQKDHKYVYSPKALQTGLIESNISNYRQVIQKVGYNSLNPKDAPRRFYEATVRDNLQGNFKTVDRSKFKTSEFIRRSEDNVKKQSGEDGVFPVRLYKRKPSADKKVVNYFIKQHLQDKRNGPDIYQNSTVNDSDLRNYYSQLNRNEVIQDQISHQPRFGLQGNQMAVRYSDHSKTIGGSSMALQKKNKYHKFVIDQNFSQWNEKYQQLQNRVESRPQLPLQQQSNFTEFKQHITSMNPKNHQRARVKKMKSSQQNNGGSSTHDFKVQLQNKPNDEQEEQQIEFKHSVTIHKEDSTKRISQAGRAVGTATLVEAMSPSERILGRTSYGDESPTDIKGAFQTQRLSSWQNDINNKNADQYQNQDYIQVMPLLEQLGDREQLITNMDEKKEVAAVLDIINRNTVDMD